MQVIDLSILIQTKPPSMIEKHIALEIIRLTTDLGLGGTAFTFGDQKPTFSREFVENAALRTRARLEITDECDSPRGGEMAAHEFFSMLGFSDFVDIDYNGRAKLTVDLGQPISPELHDKADILFDGGTIEHIPDIYQAVCNAALLVKPGGVLLQATPLNCLGNSYYCIDPMFYEDFYTLNGFKTISCYCYNRSQAYYRQSFDLQRLCAKAVRELQRMSLSKERYLEVQSKWFTKWGWQPVDRLDTIQKFNARDARFLREIKRNGMPWWMHVLWIGQKKRSILPEQIKAPCQGDYPSVVN